MTVATLIRMKVTVNEMTAYKILFELNHLNLSMKD